MSVLLFLAYGAVKIYINNYVHNINSEAVDMFFVLNNRAIYVASSGIFLKEAMATGNKVLVSRNSGTSLSF